MRDSRLICHFVRLAVDDYNHEAAAATYSAHLSTLYVLHTADYKADNGIEYLPVYMAGLL